MRFDISLLDVLNSKSKIKIIKFLLTHEASMSEREIASVLKVSHMSINRTMQELSELNLVDYVTVGKAHLWKVNRKSYTFKALSILIRGVSNIKDPLSDLKQRLLRTLPKNLVSKIVLFGSVAKALGKTNSDIDIFVLVRNKQDKENIIRFIEKLSNTCLEVYGNRLAPYLLTKLELKQKSKLKIVSEIKKGIQIYP